MSKEERRSVLRRMPGGVWVLGFVSLLMDVSSEMIHGLLPLFMTDVLGAGAVVVGLVEGVAEATALIVKIFSGVLSDWLGQRKALALSGYGLSALTKPLFALAPNLAFVFAARLADRMGKGIRGAPRDALVADLAPPDMRGAAFGLRQALDTVGAFLGPLLAVGLMLLTADNFRAVFWAAAIPAIFCVALLGFGLSEPEHAAGAARVNPIRRENLRRLGRSYWWVAAVGGIFALARFSEAFLVLRAQQTGIAIAFVPLVMAAMSMVYSATAFPFGHLADRIDRRLLLAFGLILLIAADAALSLAHHWGLVLVGVVLWGAHMGATQGLLAAMVADSAPADLRGTAFGFFNLVQGMVALLASVLAGALWQAVGPPAPFAAGALFSLLALAALAARPQAGP
jgi:MFS family permease